jgi:hypothetical protein
MSKKNSNTKTFIPFTIFLLINSHQVLSQISGTPPAIESKEESTSIQDKCPAEYIFVPAQQIYNTKDFCVSKYEMKDDGTGKAVSRPEGLPWSLPFNSMNEIMKSKCNAIGKGYELISGNQLDAFTKVNDKTIREWSLNAGFRCIINL